MLHSIGYDFHDTYLKCGGIQIAPRIATEENLYAPDPEQIRIEETGQGVSLTASRLISAGGQLSAEGELRLRLVRDDQGILHAAGFTSHGTEKIKAFILLVDGIDVAEMIGDSENMPVHKMDTPAGIPPLVYPGREAMMPLMFAKDREGTEWFLLSKDTRVNKKSFGAYYDYRLQKNIIALAHYPDQNARQNSLELPEWKIGVAQGRESAVRERCQDLEQHFDLQPLTNKQEADWIKKIQIVVNLHGEHWTGHIFNTFEQMSRHLDFLCGQFAGEEMLLFLPAWDGRYYRNYPEHLPSQRMGGAEGLKEFIRCAHEKNTHVVAMLGGPNLATYDFVKQQGFENAVMRDGSGNALIQNWVDWDMDLAPESMGYLMNFGEPAFQDYMVRKTAELYQNYGFDGVFLDGAIRYENTCNYSPVEGIRQYCSRVGEQFPDKIMMGEDGYDLLWSSFHMFATSWQPLGLENAMLRYTRQSYYLAHPDVNGSGGVHEQGWYSDGSEHVIPALTIPVLSIADGTLDTKENRRKVQAECERLKSQYQQ